MNLPECFELIPGYLSSPTNASNTPGVDWEQPTIRMFGKVRNVPRLTKWYGEAGYTYSGIENRPEPMPVWLDVIRQRVQETAGARFNSALLNLYRGGGDSIAWHADDERELGTDPTIASLSIGARRTFKIRHNATREVWSLNLGGGDLLITRGEAQRLYQHSLPKTSAPVGHRINITFRLIHP